MAAEAQRKQTLGDLGTNHMADPAGAAHLTGSEGKAVKPGPKTVGSCQPAAGRRA